MTNRIEGGADARVPPHHNPLAEVVGELSFDSPIRLVDLAAMTHSCRWCFETHRVQLVRLFLSRNRRRAVLLFQAPDAESVRLACQATQLHFERIWTCGEGSMEG